MGKRGAEQPIAAFIDDAIELDADEFAGRHGVAFLVRSVVDGPLRPPDKLSGDDWFKPNPHSTAMVPTRATKENPEAGDKFFAHAITPRRRDEDGPVNVGRAPNSDVWINDKSVSKRHATLREGDAGTFELIDRGSRNGTKVGGEALRPEEPFEVAFGKTIQFGRVRLTLMPAQQFIDFVKALRR